MRRLVLLGALATVTFASVAPDLAAQEPAERGRFPRKYLFSLIGAAVGTAVGSSYIAFQGQSQPGNCGKPSCVVAVTVSAGALIGYMIGREFDDLHALRFRGGAPLNPDNISAGLSGDPTLLTVENDLIAVGGTAGVQFFRNTPTQLRADGRRAAGVRGIAALDLAQPGAMALGSVTGLYLFPPREGPGALVRPGEIGAAVATVDRVFIGTGSRVESAPLSADTSRTWPGVDVGARVRDLEVDLARNIVWAVTDSALVALRIAGDSLESISRVPVEGRPRALAVEAARVAVAVGEQGVRLFDASDAAAPNLTAAWEGARFAYDVSLAGSRMFVAAGPEGLYVIDITAAPTVVGLARELGFAAAVTSFGQYTYVLDRSTNSVRRIESAFQ